MNRLICAVAAMAVLAGCTKTGKKVAAEPAFEARLTAVAIEGGLDGKSRPTEARAELERHLALAAGGDFTPATGAAALTVVLGAKAPDFTEKGLKLLDYRIKEVQPFITPINWGPTFRLYPFEVKYWRQQPLRDKIHKLYPEMGYEG